MSLNIVSYEFLLMKESIGKSTKFKGGIVGNMPRLVGEWGCYTEDFTFDPRQWHQNISTL
jgi:hypothetical protein